MPMAGEAEPEWASIAAAISLRPFPVGIDRQREWRKEQLPMNSKIVIKNETEPDANAIIDATVAAFKTPEISNHTEQFIVAARRGVGKALIQEGLARLNKMHARGCCLVGYPEYYKKFGFKNASGLGHEGVPPEIFFALSFDGRVPRGSVTFHDAFKAVS